MDRMLESSSSSSSRLLGPESLIVSSVYGSTSVRVHMWHNIFGKSKVHFRFLCFAYFLASFCCCCCYFLVKNVSLSPRAFLPESPTDDNSSAYLLCVQCKDSFQNAWDLMVHAQAAHMLNIYELGVPRLNNCSSPSSSPRDTPDKVRRVGRGNLRKSWP